MEQQLADQKNSLTDLGMVIQVELNHFSNQIKKQDYHQ